jgi:hypothetical protein
MTVFGPPGSGVRYTQVGVATCPQGMCQVGNVSQFQASLSDFPSGTIHANGASAVLVRVATCDGSTVNVEFIANITLA